MSGCKNGEKLLDERFTEEEVRQAMHLTRLACEKEEGFTDLRPWWEIDYTGILAELRKRRERKE